MAAGAGLFKAQIGKRVSYPPIAKDHYVSNSAMSNFFVEQGRTRVFGKTYSTYVAAGKPRRTLLDGKRAISGWTPGPALAVSRRSCGVEEYI
jgi:hypothetical protein